MARLTPAAVEKRLRHAVVAGHVRIVQRPLKAAVAQVGISATGPHLIQLDPLRGGLMDSLVHELIHVVYLRELEAWGAFEEVIVCALEEALVKWINRSHRRVEWWRQRIEEALETSD